MIMLSAITQTRQVFIEAITQCKLFDLTLAFPLYFPRFTTTRTSHARSNVRLNAAPHAARFTAEPDDAGAPEKATLNELEEALSKHCIEHVQRDFA